MRMKWPLHCPMYSKLLSCTHGCAHNSVMVLLISSLQIWFKCGANCKSSVHVWLDCNPYRRIASDLWSLLDCASQTPSTDPLNLTQLPLLSEWMSVKICVMQAATNVVPSLETHVSIEHMYIVCHQLFEVWQIQELLSVNLTVCLTSFRRCEVA